MIFRNCIYNWCCTLIINSLFLTFILSFFDKIREGHLPIENRVSRPSYVSSKFMIFFLHIVAAVETYLLINKTHTHAHAQYILHLIN